MLKNRFTLITPVLVVALMSLVIASPFSNASESRDLSWPPKSVIIPATGTNELTDYYQRHPELRIDIETSFDTSEYFFRHPELRVGLEVTVDTSDYFFRHPELSSK